MKASEVLRNAAYRIQDGRCRFTCLAIADVESLGGPFLPPSLALAAPAGKLYLEMFYRAPFWEEAPTPENQALRYQALIMAAQSAERMETK